MLQPTTKQIGNDGEERAARYLMGMGHTIVERNWRTKLCEIDIISRFGDTLYFTEVKYRKTAQHGDGIAAITPKKLRKMTFAAELYMTKRHIEKLQPRLVAIGVDSSGAISYLEIE